MLLAEPATQQTLYDFLSLAKQKSTRLVELLKKLPREHKMYSTIRSTLGHGNGSIVLELAKKATANNNNNNNDDDDSSCSETVALNVTSSEAASRLLERATRFLKDLNDRSEGPCCG